MAFQKNQILGISFIVRILFMLVIFYLPIHKNLKIILILAGDFLDCWTTKFIDYIQDGIHPLHNTHCKEFNYQITDKVVDLLSYLIVMLLLPPNPLYITTIIFRAVGVGMFYKTRNSHWLIFFPDLFKEVALFEIFVGTVTPHILLIIIGHKVIFEYMWHTYVNHRNYKKLI